MADLDADVRALLQAPNFAHVATLLPDGSPTSVAVWAGLHEERPYFFTQPQSLKARNLARDGRIAMSLVDRENPYRSGRLRGRVNDTVEGDDALVLIDALSVAYTGEPFPMRSGVVYLVDVDSSGSMTLPFADTPAA
jgi:PPOX class probable F420-dependent enzyme